MKIETKFSIDDIIARLDDIDVIGVIGLSEISSSHHVVYRFVRDLYKSEFQPNERIIIYGKEKPSIDLLSHIQESLKVYDVSNSFVLLLCPGDIREDLEKVRQLHSTDDFPISHQDIEIADSELVPNFTLPKTICPLPWTQIKIHANGDMAPCCLYDYKNAFLDSQGKSININTHTISEFYHSDRVKQIRHDMISGVYHKGCSACWNAEEKYFSSTRTHAFTVQGKDFYPIDYKKDSIDSFMALDLEMGNLCNLKCNICSWARSSQIAAEVIKLTPTMSDKIKKFNRDASWVDDTATLEKIIEFDENIKFLEFEGGEPLLHIYHHDLLKHFVDIDQAQNIRLRYSTNGTIFPDKMLPIWEKFKEVNVCLSIDDIGKRFEYQRTNAEWKTVEQNLQKFRDCNVTTLKPSIFATVNLQNVFYLPELLEYFKKYNWPVIFSLLSIPKELALGSMPQQAKDMVLEKLCSFADEFPILNPVIKSIKESTSTDGQGFRDFIKNLDARRGRNFKESHRKMAEAMAYNI